MINLLSILKAKLIKYTYLLIISVALILQACPTPPEFNNTPRINFEGLNTTQEEVIINPESPVVTEDIINLTIYFEDGDGNLGHSENEALFEPFQEFEYPLSASGNLISINSSDTLPDYNPLDYRVVAETDSVLIGNFLVSGDTIYVRRNPRHNNIFVDFYYSPPSANGDFVLFDWEAAPYYSSFDGRFPPVNSENYARPLNGTIKYQIRSEGFAALFRNYPVQLEIYILDREGNKSNVIITPPFTF